MELISLFQPSYGGIRQELGRLQFPPGESPRVSKMYIYSGSSQADCAAPALPAPRYPVVYHEGVQVLRSQRETWGKHELQVKEFKKYKS